MNLISSTRWTGHRITRRKCFRMRLSCSLIVKGFPKLLREKYGNEEAGIIWESAEIELERLNKGEFRKDKYAPYIFPFAAVYQALSKLHPEDANALIDEYGNRMGTTSRKSSHLSLHCPVSRLFFARHCLRLPSIQVLPERDMSARSSSVTPKTILR